MFATWRSFSIRRLVKAGKTRQAQALAEAGLSRHPKDFHHLVQAAEAAYEDRNLERARELWRAVEEGWPQTPSCYAKQMLLARKTKDLKEADRILDAAHRALGANPDSGAVLARLAFNYIAIKMRLNRNFEWTEELSEAVLAWSMGEDSASDHLALTLADPFVVPGPTRFRFITNLINWGLYQPAGRLIQRLLEVGPIAEREALAVLSNRLQNESAGSQQEKKTEFIIAQFEKLGDPDGREALLGRKEGASALTICFIPNWANFNIYTGILSRYLRGEDTHQLYLTDRSEYWFMKGIPSFGGTQDATRDRVQALVNELRDPEVNIVGVSLGGYVALEYAIALKARAFLGIGIRSDMSQKRADGAQKARLRAARQEISNRLVDLKPGLQASGYPQKGILYFGEGSRLIRSQAEHLADLPNFSLHPIPGYSGNGTFSAMLKADMLKDGIRLLFSPTTEKEMDEIG